MRKARSKHQSLFLKLQIDDQRPTRRVAYLLTESKLYRRVLGNPC